MSSSRDIILHFRVKIEADVLVDVKRCDSMPTLVAITRLNQLILRQRVVLASHVRSSHSAMCAFVDGARMVVAVASSCRLLANHLATRNKYHLADAALDMYSPQL